jgi:hypothetical protein
VGYFDSSYIAKFYLDEPESDAVRRLADALGQVRCVSLRQIEATAVFHRKLSHDGRGASFSGEGDVGDRAVTAQESR